MNRDSDLRQTTHHTHTCTHTYMHVVLMHTYTVKSKDERYNKEKDCTHEQRVVLE